MAVRCRQRLEPMNANKIFLEVLEVNPETQAGERRLVDQCAELPDVKTMDLELMLNAGVPLDQVDCKLINPVGTVGLADPKPAEKDPMPAENVETKTEEN